MKNREQKKGIAVNTLYTMGGLLWMNAVLQIVVTPLLNRLMGAEQLGNLLYITGLVAIICPSVGQALNTSRLVVRRDCEITNGDYDWLLLIFGAIGSVAALVMSRNSITNMAMAAGVFYYVYADCFSILRRCGISSEPELPEIFHLLSVDRNRISGRIRNILCNRTMGMDLSDW